MRRAKRHSAAGANPIRQLPLQPIAVGADDGGNHIVGGNRPTTNAYLTVGEPFRKYDVRSQSRIGMHQKLGGNQAASCSALPAVSSFFSPGYHCSNFSRSAPSRARVRVCSMSGFSQAGHVNLIPSHVQICNCPQVFGASYRFHVWHDSVLYRAEASWMAVGR